MIFEDLHPSPVPESAEEMARRLEISPREMISLYHGCCPSDLSPIKKLQQIKDRILGSRELFGEEITREVRLGNRYFCGPFETGGKGPECLDRTFIYFSRQTNNEGDYGITILTQPFQDDPTLIRVATIGFIATLEMITITNLQGNVSGSNHAAVRKFGRYYFENANLYGRLQNTLNGGKPFNMLIGLLIEIGLAKGIPHIRGVEKNLLPFDLKEGIKHHCQGIYCAVGFRPTPTNPDIFETSIKTPEDRQRCFARITGKNPRVKIPRETAFILLKNALAQECPFLFESPKTEIDKNISLFGGHLPGR